MNAFVYQAFFKKFKLQKIGIFIFIFAFLFNTQIAFGFSERNDFYTRMIKDPEFKQADILLNQAYKNKMESLNNSEKIILRTKQREWIAERDRIIASSRESSLLSERILSMVRDRIKMLNETRIENTTGNSGLKSESGFKEKIKSESGRLALLGSRSNENKFQASQSLLKGHETKNLDKKLNAFSELLMQQLDKNERSNFKRTQEEWLRRREKIIEEHQSNEHILKVIHDSSEDRSLGTRIENGKTSIYVKKKQLGDDEIQKRVAQTLEGEKERIISQTEARVLDLYSLILLREYDLEAMQVSPLSLKSKLKKNQSDWWQRASEVRKEILNWAGVEEHRVNHDILSARISALKIYIDRQRKSGSDAPPFPIYQTRSLDRSSKIIIGEKYKVSFTKELISVFDSKTDLFICEKSTHELNIVNGDDNKFSGTISLLGDEDYLKVSYRVFDKDGLTDDAFFSLPDLNRVGAVRYTTLENVRSFGPTPVVSGPAHELNPPLITQFREFNLLDLTSKGNLPSSFGKIDVASDGMVPGREESAHKDAILAVEVFDTKIKFHGIKHDRLQTLHLDLDELCYHRSNWEGPDYSTYDHDFDTIDSNGRLVLVSSVGAVNRKISFKKTTNSNNEFLASVEGFSTPIALNPGPYAWHLKSSFFIYPKNSASPDLVLHSLNIDHKHSHTSEFSINNATSQAPLYSGNATASTPTLQSPGHYFDELNHELWVNDTDTYENKATGGPSVLNNGWHHTNSILRKLSIKDGSEFGRLEGLNDFETFGISENWIIGLPKMDQKVAEIWSKSPIKKIVSLYWDEYGHFTLVNSNGYYATSGQNAKKVAFQFKDHAYPLEQFDVRLNRPDLVFRDLGYPTEVTALMHDIYLRRLKKMGLSEEVFSPSFKLPTIDFRGDVPISTDRPYVDLAIAAKDNAEHLKAIKVLLNGNPVNGMNGEDLLQLKTSRLDRTIRVALAHGRNKVQISVVNTSGAESVALTTEISREGIPPRSNLYLVSIGVSTYEDSQWNLKYAAKDALDVARHFHAAANSMGYQFLQLVLTDKKVTKRSILEVAKLLEKATEDDIVVFFIAGHGVLDSSLDYFFATHDIDFKNPASKGVKFEEFEGILAGIRSLKKVMFVDTCHAGELDDEEKSLLASARLAAPAVASRLSRAVTLQPIAKRGLVSVPIQKARGKSEWVERINRMFLDLRRGSGATIISSSAGAEYAFESSEQKNGLFTFSLLESLTAGSSADYNKNGAVSLSEIATFVRLRVNQLTDGRQKPNVRRMNIETDFDLVKVTH